MVAFDHFFDLRAVCIYTYTHVYLDVLVGLPRNAKGSHGFHYIFVCLPGLYTANLARSAVPTLSSHSLRVDHMCT